MICLRLNSFNLHRVWSSTSRFKDNNVTSDLKVDSIYWGTLRTLDTKGFVYIFLMDLLSQCLSPPRHLTQRHRSLVWNYFVSFNLTHFQQMSIETFFPESWTWSEWGLFPLPHASSFLMFFFFGLASRQVTSVKIGMYKQNIHGAAHHAPCLFGVFLLCVFFPLAFFRVFQV